MATGDGVTIGSVSYTHLDVYKRQNATIEFFDATLRSTPVKLRLEQIAATVDKLRLPELNGQSPIKLDGVLKGVKQDGKISISGSIELATKESVSYTHLDVYKRQARRNPARTQS